MENQSHFCLAQKEKPWELPTSAFILLLLLEVLRRVGERLGVMWEQSQPRTPWKNMIISQSNSSLSSVKLSHPPSAISMVTPRIRAVRPGAGSGSSKKWHQQDLSSSCPISWDKWVKDGSNKKRTIPISWSNLASPRARPSSVSQLAFSAWWFLHRVHALLSSLLPPHHNVLPGWFRAQQQHCWFKCWQLGTFSLGAKKQSVCSPKPAWEGWLCSGTSTNISGRASSLQVWSWSHSFPQC